MHILEVVNELAQRFKMKAQEVDLGGSPPIEHLAELAAQGYFRFVADAAPGPRRRALDYLSSGCGVTSFLVTQHEGVCRRLFQAEHPSLEEAVNGSIWFGVCFAHLRRDPSPVDALEFRDHVIYSGTGPWFSGYGVMQQMMVGGATPDGQFLMGLSRMEVPEILIRPLPKLSVMEATATVGLDFNALRVEAADIIVRTDAEGLAERDKFSTVFQSARSLGAARAAAEFLPDTGKAAVLRHLEQQHARMDLWDLEPNWTEATALRQQALSLAGRVVEAAFVNVGGKAHSLSHPLQRISREAAFYSTTQLTQQLKRSITEQLKKQLEDPLCV
jgi:hypothetical protein